jgi:hypothetical protein
LRPALDFGRIITHGPQTVGALGSVSSALRVLAKEKRKIFRHDKPFVTFE